MKASFYAPLSVVNTIYALKKYHIIYPVEITDTHVDIAHLDTINGLFKTTRTITLHQFQNYYRPLRQTEVHLID